MSTENGTEKTGRVKLSRAGKRRYRHKRTPCPEPGSGQATWLRGRRKSPGVLLALHYAAVLLKVGEQTSAHLYNGAIYEAYHSEKEPWLPKAEVFFRWLQHHRIARKIDRNLWVAGLSASAFALIPNRSRVQKIGAMILARENFTHVRSGGSGGTSNLTLPFLSEIELDPPTFGQPE